VQKLCLAESLRASLAEKSKRQFKDLPGVESSDRV
jgi:hypothetical protein